MVTLEVKRSRRDASCCNVEVVKGAAGRRRYGLSSKDVTANSACSNPPANDLAEASSRCTTSALDLSWPLSLKSRPVATRVSSIADSFALKDSSVSVKKFAPISQYDGVTKSIRSVTRSCYDVR